MKKLLISLILTTIFIVSCFEGTLEEPIIYQDCNVKSDCPRAYEQVCQEGKCMIDACLNASDCGKGKCVFNKKEGDDKETFHCECSENAVFAEEYQKCVPTCDGYSEECANFGVNINRCHMGLGRCDSICYGEGSCKEGWYCSTGGACRKRDN